MVATLLFMPTENDPPPLCAPPQPSHEDVLTAQKDALAARALTEVLTGRMETRVRLLQSLEVMAQQEQRGRTDQLCELFFNNP